MTQWKEDAITSTRLIACGMCGRRIPVTSSSSRGVVTCSCGLRIDFVSGERPHRTPRRAMLILLVAAGVITALYFLIPRLI